MPQFWKEQPEPYVHRNHMVTGCAGPSAVTSRWIYFVRVCGFTFEFASVDQIKEYLAFYSRKIHPTSRLSVYSTTNLVHEKGEWERWYERLPLYLQEEPKRQRVVKALAAAIERFAPAGSNVEVR